MGLTGRVQYVLWDMNLLSLPVYGMEQTHRIMHVNTQFKRSPSLMVKKITGKMVMGNIN